MSYRIDARLNGSNPQLEVRDADSGTVRLLWEYPRELEDSSDPLARELAIEELFRRLFLLTTKDRLRRQ
ncbi:hypothetical protein KBTX_02682 [wastewater metagenome]|uniref:Uncharacterized protein n=2 Tax=unclassified sequences TaxID=12908 RepID=A0A5B8RC18_9ZZZZ|nr:hypothetical protein [Arhodomonas aquaeolei]MCS4503438.1 hypothetical protein [Arhodomonas aquaeolei]QEA06350.1 hypothetical protein KBTEX_02682 [uncultured organism]